MDFEKFLERIRQSFGFKNDSEMEKKIGLSNGYCWKLKNGKITSPDAIIRWLKEKNADINFFLQGNKNIVANSQMTSPIIETHTIPLIKQKVSCGSGVSWEEGNIECYLEPIAPIPAMFGKKVFAFRASGVSMMGLGIQDGDILFFDGSADQQLKDGVYVFGFAGDAYCKLLRFEPLENKVMVYSVQKQDLREAELVRTIEADSEDFHIFGRVLAWLHENTVLRGI